MVTSNEGLPPFPSRRDFLAGSSHAAAGAWLMKTLPFLAVIQACATEAEEAGADFVTFTEREAADFDAFSARIVPTDDTPGAREAGVLRFADQALDGAFADLLPIVRGGLADLHGRTEGGPPFAELPEAEQDVIMAAIEQAGPFFFFGRTLVMVGMVANQEYGANQNDVGWDLIGFDHSFAYQPPFGHYDRNEHGPGAEGAQ